MSNIERFVILSVALIIGVVGCSKMPSTTTEGPTPSLNEIPLQEAGTGIELRMDLSEYADNTEEQILTWEILSGPGSIDSGTYVSTFYEVGSVEITVRATNESGNTADADFVVVALHGHMAIVQNGNGLEVLDAGSGIVYPIDIGGNLPLVYREILPDGSLIYEKMGGSGIDLFHYDHTESRQIGDTAGLNTVYDNHTPDGRIFFEQGSAAETSLNLWDPETDETTRVAWRPAMHNRNAFFAPPDIVYFEYGNNGQADVHFWQIGVGESATAYSSGHSEEIKTVLPDGGVIFATKGLLDEDELLYYRKGRGLFTVGGDLPASVQDQDINYVTISSQGLVVFESGGASKDLWIWNPLGLTTNAIAATSADERFSTISSDDLITYSTTPVAGNSDLKIYNYSTSTSTDIGVNNGSEVFELLLSDSDVIYAVETTAGRSLHRFDVASNTNEIIADFASENYTAVAALSNDRLIYTRDGASTALFTWNPATGTSVQAGGSNASYAGQGPHGGFLMYIAAFGQTDLALWDGTNGQVTTITQTPQDETLEAVFDNGAVIYSVVVPPKTSTDLFQWQDSMTTRLTNGNASYSVVSVLRGNY